MDFQSSEHLGGIEDEDESCITIDTEGVHSGTVFVFLFSEVFI